MLAATMIARFTAPSVAHTRAPRQHEELRAERSKTTGYKGSAFGLFFDANLSKVL